VLLDGGLNKRLEHRIEVKKTGRLDDNAKIEFDGETGNERCHK
jgi:hypothetical protein